MKGRLKSMAHSTANSVTLQPAKTHSDWLTFLCSALFDGLKAYGASLMIVSSSDSSCGEAAAPPTRIQPIPRPQIKLAVKTSALANPAWRHA
jgi:hypothetical protein